MLKEIVDLFQESFLSSMVHPKVREIGINNKAFSFSIGGGALEALGFDVSFKFNRLIDKPKILGLLDTLSCNEVSVYFYHRKIRNDSTVEGINLKDRSGHLSGYISSSENKFIQDSKGNVGYSSQEFMLIVSHSPIVKESIDEFIKKSFEEGIVLSQVGEEKTKAHVLSCSDFLGLNNPKVKKSKFGELSLEGNNGKRMDVVRLEFYDSIVPLSCDSGDILRNNEFNLLTHFYYYIDEAGASLKSMSHMDIYFNEINNEKVDGVVSLFNSLSHRLPTFDVVKNTVGKVRCSLPGNPIDSRLIDSLYFLWGAKDNFSEASISRSQTSALEDILPANTEGEILLEDHLGNLNFYSLDGKIVFASGDRSKNIETFLIPIIEHKAGNNGKVIICDSPEGSNMSLLHYSSGSRVEKAHSLIYQAGIDNSYDDTFLNALGLDSHSSTSDVVKAFKEIFPETGLEHRQCSTGDGITFLSSGGEGDLLGGIMHAQYLLKNGVTDVLVVINNPYLIAEGKYSGLIRKLITAVAELGGSVFIANERYHTMMSIFSKDEIFLNNYLIGFYELGEFDSDDPRFLISHPSDNFCYQECFIRKGDEISFVKTPYSGRIKFLTNCSFHDSVLIGGYVDNGYSFEKAVMKQLGDFSV